MKDSRTALALKLIQRENIVLAQDLRAKKIPADYLDRLHRRGLIERIARGVYVHAPGPVGTPDV